MSKTKVLVFTQFEKWDNNIDRALHQRVEDTNWDEKYPDIDKTIPIEILIAKCGFSKDSKKAFLEPIDLNELSNEAGVFLVYDSMDENSFKILEQQCSDHEVYVLTHSTGTCQQNRFGTWQKKPSVLSGTHDNEKEHRYYPLFDILTDDKDEKLNRIIDTIFKPYNKLETILQFLHGCLVQNNDDDSFLAAYNKLFDDNNIKDVVKDFYENIDSNQSKNYIVTLAGLRDNLLEFALTKN